MDNILILPKQTGQFDAFITSLKLYYDSYKRKEQWYSNNDFKAKILKELPYLAKGAKNPAYLVKQSELTRYFGLVFYDYKSYIGRAHITDEGIKFYEAYLNDNKELQLDIIMNSICNNSFGRNNTAVKSSNSDIDPPKLFLKSIIDMNGITKKSLAYLFYLTNNLEINYYDSIIELSKIDSNEVNIPEKFINKYNDIKFMILLEMIGIVKKKNKIYFLSDYVNDKYSDKIRNLSIYNKEPDIKYDESDENNKINIFYSEPYDLNSDLFQNENNRIPVKSTNNKKNERYKTNNRISKTVLDKSNYKCIIDNNHKTFKTKIEKQYMEPHHFIPMAAQKDFKINLDRIENIVSICPTCHCAIHYGNKETRFKLVEKIYKLKEKKLKEVGLNISLNDLFNKYYK